MPSLRLTTSIAAPVDACFDLSLSVDAHTASMARSRERIVGGVRTGRMSLHDTVTWRATHFGLPFQMTSQITAHDRPRRFVDEQVRGPFARWWHEHLFNADGGGTVMVDHVEYASPLGPLGRAVDRLVLERYLVQLLHQRNLALQQQLEDAQHPGP